MASSVGELKRILSDFNTRYNAIMSAIVSRSGTPIAWNMPKGLPVENMAALSATLLGASEVIYSGMSKSQPKRILVESENGILVVSSLGHKAFIVAMFLKMGSEVDRGMEEVSRAIISVLKGQT